MVVQDSIDSDEGDVLLKGLPLTTLPPAHLLDTADVVEQGGDVEVVALMMQVQPVGPDARFGDENADGHGVGVERLLCLRADRACIVDAQFSKKSAGAPLACCLRSASDFRAWPTSSNAARASFNIFSSS